jgi:thioredoxin reductase (NADPH)
MSTCAVCDAAFYKDKTVFVVGGGDAAMEDALALARFTNKVTIIHRKSEFRASKIMQKRVLEEKKIPVLWETEVVGVGGESSLKTLKLKTMPAGRQDSKTQNIEEVKADGLFLAIGHTPATDILKGQVELDNHGYLVTQMTAPTASQLGRQANNQEIWLNGYPTQTSVTGVFGAGDMVDIRYRQAITAAGMGCMAALDVEKFLTGSISGW